MLHYTDDSGYKGIAAHVVWVFKASRPPGPHPTGAYFTTLVPGAANLAKRFRIPKRKLKFAFIFLGQEGLVPLEGGRGAYVFWSPVDYHVAVDRQEFKGRTEDAP